MKSIFFSRFLSPFIIRFNRFLVLSVTCTSLGLSSNVLANINSSSANPGANSTNSNSASKNSTSNAELQNSSTTPSQSRISIETNNNQASTQVLNESYLFVQSVTKAKIERNKKNPETYIITLHNVSPYVIRFSERPVRKTALVPISQLLSLWEIQHQEGFKMNPPNADINGVHEKDKDTPINYIVQLTDPVYNKETKTLSYTAKPVNGNSFSMPDNATLNHVNLFIDNVCPGCWWP